MSEDEQRRAAGEYLNGALDTAMQMIFRHKCAFPELQFVIDAVSKAHTVVIDTENQIRLRETHAFLAGARHALGVNYDYELPTPMEFGGAALRYAGTDAQGKPTSPTQEGPR